nr:Ig-like domain-containing protein [Flavipsychrobacter sp.]
MKRSAYSFLPFLACLFLWTSCANVTHPTGGEKDIRAPRLLSIHPKDSQLNTRVTRIEMQFDEFVTVSNASTEVKTLPILPFPISTVAKNKKVIVKIPDSLLKDRTTYRISFGNAIADVHENNVFKSYEYVFSTGSYFDSMKIGGSVLNAATGEKDSSAIILLYSSSRSDSEVLREKPDYYVKASATGDFIFYGLPNRPFKMIALRDADANLLYDGEKEWIGFTSKIITPIDSLNEKNVFDIAISSLADTVTTSVSLQTSNRPGGKTTTSNPEEVKPNHPTSSEDQDFTYSVSVD